MNSEKIVYFYCIALAFIFMNKMGKKEKEKIYKLNKTN